MLTSLRSYFTSFLAGTLAFGLTACQPSTTSQPLEELQKNTNQNSTPTTEVDEDVLTLTFGVYTADKPTTVVKQFRPALNALEVEMSESMGQPIKIKMEVANSYEKGIRQLVNGDVDFSRLGPASYIEAKRDNPELSILAIESKGGEKVFYGIIAVHEESNIQRVSQLVGKSFAFGDELSTIGRFLSQQHLYENGITSSNLSRYEYLGRHDKVGEAVGLKQFDAGALKEGTFKKLVDKGTSIRSIAKFPNVEKPWISSSELSEELHQELSQALLEISNTEALEPLGVEGFLTGTDLDYEAIKIAIEENNKFFE